MHRSAPLRVVGFVRAADAVAARAGDKRIDAAEACGDARQEAGPVGGARGVAGQREAPRFGSQRVERRLAAPDQHDAVAAAGEAARAGGADAGAGAGNGDRAGGRVRHVVLRKGGVPATLGGAGARRYPPKG